MGRRDEPGTASEEKVFARAQREGYRCSWSHGQQAVVRTFTRCDLRGRIETDVQSALISHSEGARTSAARIIAMVSLGLPRFPMMDCVLHAEQDQIAPSRTGLERRLKRNAWCGRSFRRACGAVVGGREADRTLVHRLGRVP